MYTSRKSKPLRRNSRKIGPGLWSRLPPVLIHIIRRKIVDSLSFSKLQCFCRFCKSWGSFIIPSTPYLVYFYMGDLIAFHAGRGLWEKISLDFCVRQVPGLKLIHLHLVSSGGGLLYLSRNVTDEYIVCNPLTEYCRRLTQRPPASGAAEPKLQTRLVVYSMWSQTQNPAQSVTKPGRNILQSAFVYHTDMRGAVQLMVNNSGHSRGETKVHEYSRTHWSPAVVITDGFSFFINGPIMHSPEMLCLGFRRAAQPSGWLELLVYDLKQRECSWVPSEHLPVNTTNRSRKHLVGSLGTGRRLEFMDITDTGSKRPAFPPPFAVFQTLLDCVPEAVRKSFLPRGTKFKSVYVEQDDNVYYVVLSSSFPDADSSVPPTGDHGQAFRMLAVWLHNRADNSDIVSARKNNWGYRSSWCPFGASFHIFKPSFETPV